MEINLNTLYDKSPIFIQNLMVSVKGYIQNKKRYGRHYKNYRDFLNKFDSLSFEAKKDYQLKELTKFIAYSRVNSKFYNKSYLNIKSLDIKSISDLKNLPIIDKELLRQEMPNVVTIKKKGNVEDHTGGTTGKSLTVLTTPEDMMERMATLDNFKARVGFEHLKMKRATFNGKHIIPPQQKKKIFWRYNLACKQMIFSSFHLSNENLVYYVNELNKFKPDAIDGFFTSMCDVANYIDRNKIKLTFTPKAIFPTSETLTKEGRALLEKVFNCNVYNQYASSEGAPFITECSEKKLHIEMASGVFENISKSNNEILVTSFSTHGTPLIRYKIGDSILFDDKNTSCKCGISSTIVHEICGRKLDYIFTHNGAKINSGNISNLFKSIPNSIIRAQVCQKNIGEVKILLNVDKNIYKSHYDEILKNEFLHKFGHETSIIIEHVDDIPREKSGKYSFIKNLVQMNN